MVKTADRPHTITVLLSAITVLVSLSALAVSLFSLQQSRSAQLATKATSRAMLVLKSAQLRSTGNVVGTQYRKGVVFDFQLRMSARPSRTTLAFNTTWRYGPVTAQKKGGTPWEKNGEGTA